MINGEGTMNAGKKNTVTKKIKSPDRIMEKWFRVVEHGESDGFAL